MSKMISTGIKKKVDALNKQIEETAKALGYEAVMHESICSPVRSLSLSDDGILTYQEYSDETETWMDCNDSYITEEDGEEMFDEYNFNLDISTWRRAIRKAVKVAEMENEANKADRELTDEEIANTEED